MKHVICDLTKPIGLSNAADFEQIGTLATHFKLTSLKEWQNRVVKAALEGQNSSSQQEVKTVSVSSYLLT